MLVQHRPMATQNLDIQRQIVILVYVPYDRLVRTGKLRFKYMYLIQKDKKTLRTLKTEILKIVMKPPASARKLNVLM